jgi:phage terminase large subunit-like protein
MINTSTMSRQQIVAAGGQWQDFIDSLSEEEAYELLHDWNYWSRPNQRMPEGMGDKYRVWFFRAGRGAGKTRAGAEAVRRQIESVERIALIAPTAADVRDVLIEGDSGIMSVFPFNERPEYEPSKRRITFANGARAYAYSAEEPERLRGPQHGFAWMDEPASMPNGEETMSNLLLGLRLGSSPWLMVTGTPKPLPWLRALASRTDTISTTGSTYENASNLAPGFIDDVLARYEGTRLGRQELYAEWLEDVEGALWTEKMIDRTRLAGFEPQHPLKAINAYLTDKGKAAITDRRAWRIIVAVDPPGETAECGIVVGMAPVQGRAGIDRAVILEDASTAGRPEEWGARVANTARKWNAERVVVESNQGGDMVRATIHAVDPNLRVDKITAKISKGARAEPISALYERGLVHHAGFFPMLEVQMTSFVPGEGKSPDRMDALVHCVTTLLPAQPLQRASVQSPIHRRIT